MGENVSAQDVVLLLLKHHGGEIHGKTVLQKVAYFVSVRTNRDLSFSPHFFGPYSRTLQNALDLLVLSGSVEEQERVIGTNTAGAPIRHYLYKISPAGESLAEGIVKKKEEVSEQTAFVLERIGQQHADKSARPLSLAAKVHFILSNRNRALTADEISKASQELGWEVRPKEVDRAIDLLKKLELVNP